MRTGTVKRETNETRIELQVNLDGRGIYQVENKMGFFDHMLRSFTCHGLFDLQGSLAGDLHIDHHHLVEDTGLALGRAINQALGTKKGIQRAGFFILPMDETLVMTALDISGRPFCRLDADLTGTAGDFPCSLTEDFCWGLATGLAATLHLKVFYGRSQHHMVEALFKALGRALRQAVALDERLGESIMSTKGTL